MASSTQVATRPVRKRPKKEKFDVLSCCPTTGAGWCVYPFNLAKLEKQMKLKSSKPKSINTKSTTSTNSAN